MDVGTLSCFIPTVILLKKCFWVLWPLIAEMYYFRFLSKREKETKETNETLPRLFMPISGSLLILFFFLYPWDGCKQFCIES